MLYLGLKMKCPYCSYTGSKVTDKRMSPNRIRRRRECLKCKKRYTTYEEVDKGDLYVIKKDNTREKFVKEKLASGINKALEKRPVEKEKVDKIVNEIEEKLRRKGKKEIKSELIGEEIMKRLKKIDNIAYIRFASVYRDFQDVEDFKKALSNINQ